MAGSATYLRGQGPRVGEAAVQLGALGQHHRGGLSRRRAGTVAEPEQMAELVHKKMEAKKPLLREALQGRVTPHHRFMLRELLGQIDHLDQMIETFDHRIEEVMSPLERESVKRLDEIPGFDQRTGQNLIAEIGTDMSRFPSARHLASWAGLCPGNNESAGKHRSGGKRKSGRTRKANRWLKATLTQAAWGASRTRRSYFSAQHRRLTTRRGVKRATIAVAHSLLAVSHCLLSRHEMYIDLGVNHFVPDPKRQADQMVRRLQRMGYTVDLKAA